MTPAPFWQVPKLVEGALEKKPVECEAFLAETAQADTDLCAQAERLVAEQERTATFLDASVVAPAERRTSPRRMEGRRLGAYEVLREIGRGGMGTVYLARRADGLFDQSVAIKLVNPESAAQEILARFDQERAILASLEHPNIARLYDGGSTDEGWPYFVMEYVEGKPIDDWCDERRLNVSARVSLFRTVCDAVQCAHHHHVIHRDLKPGNILVTADGVVKLLDFGIAKLVHLDTNQKTVLATRTGVRLMTPEYASPEQIRSEAITPLTDIYSLGVILYELLTGRRPYRLKSRIFHEIVRVVCEQPPTRPSAAVTEIDERPGAEGQTITIAPGLLSQAREGTPSDLKRRLSGDLDSIVLKALEKDPPRRYRSIEQFSTDLGHHLSGQPIVADRSSGLMELASWARHHRLALVAGSALLLALLTGGIRVDWRGIATIASAAAFLGVWHIATDRDLGARLSERVAMGGWLVGAGLVIVGSALSLAHYLFPAASGDLVIRMVILLVASLGLVNTISLLIGWAGRSRWSGELVTSIRTEDRSMFLTGFLLFSSGAHMYRFLWDSFNHRSPVDPYLMAVVLAFLVAMAVHIFMIFPHLEVRDRGLLHHGRLISWLNIDSYEWESTASPQDLIIFSMRPKRVVLRLHVSRLFSILPAPRIHVPDDRQEELEAILKRHLGEWPGR